MKKIIIIVLTITAIFTSNFHIATAATTVELKVKKINASKSKDEFSIPWGSSITYKVTAFTNGRESDAFEEDEEYWTILDESGQNPNVYIKQWGEEPWPTSVDASGSEGDFHWNPVKYIKIYAPFGFTGTLKLTAHFKYSPTVTKDINLIVKDGTNITGKRYFNYQPFDDVSVSMYPEIFNKNTGDYTTTLPLPSINTQKEIYVYWNDINDFRWGYWYEDSKTSFDKRENDSRVSGDPDLKPNIKYVSNIKNREIAYLYEGRFDNVPFILCESQTITIRPGFIYKPEPPKDTYPVPSDWRRVEKSCDVPPLVQVTNIPDRTGFNQIQVLITCSLTVLMLIIGFSLTRFRRKRKISTEL